MRGRKLKKQLLSHCQSESLSEEGLREIIERHSSFHLSSYRFFHAACNNDRVNEGIIRYLIEYFPRAASSIDENGCSPLYFACANTNVTPNIVQLLVDAAPDSVGSVHPRGGMPLHNLCRNKTLDDEAAALEILELLIEKHPEAVRHADNDGGFPIHCAAFGGKAPEFCRLLIEAYPGSERIANRRGMLPLYCACRNSTLATVKYFYKLYPDAINQTTTTTRGLYPIHTAIFGVQQRLNPIVALGVVKYLLGCDPNVKLQKIGRTKSLLYFACRPSYNYHDSYNYNDSNIEAALEIIEAIYDAHPEAIKENRIASTIHRYHRQVRKFINGQLVYARQAKDRHVMTTPDDNGRLPLHTALQINAALGSIKLLVKGNPPALQTPDSSGTLPLHIACQHHKSADVIQYLVRLDATTLDAVDHEGNTALHYACRGAKYDTIALLLEKYDAVSVSKQNMHNKLPIDLLWESSGVDDRGSVEYTESIFRLLSADPATLMNIDTQK